MFIPRFQFLIGTLKTSLDVFVDGVLEEGFQFLIGTLKKHNKPLASGKFAKFQFLIGTLKTQDEAWNGEWRCPFQFLIGTLKTKFPYCVYFS